ncbi:MAG: Spy/CpxP family protein refolding chaperone [Acetobacteraceae bacterium]
MTRITASVLAIGVSALLAGAAPPAAFAQTTPTTPAMPATPSTAHPRGTTPPERAAQQLAQMHQELGITPAQEGPWDQFAQANTKIAGDLNTAFRDRAAQTASMNAVENMKSFADLDVKRAEDMQGLVQQFQVLYAALSPDQQHKVDAMFRQNTERAAARHAAHAKAHR